MASTVTPLHERQHSTIAAADATYHCRALFLSDIHLGMRGCQVDQLLDFLRVYDADVIYLIGDVVDGWLLKSHWFWPQKYNDVVQKLLRKARKGTRVVYIPGNHDEFLRNFVDAQFGGIEVVAHAIHESADGRRLFITHGDQFDLVVGQARWLAVLGGHVYDGLVGISRRLSVVRRYLGFPYWSLSQWAKAKVKSANAYIGDFERALEAEARQHGADGVICGHIHHPTIHDAGGFAYMNCGDWIENCTAIAEHADGRFELIAWGQHREEDVVFLRRAA